MKRQQQPRPKSVTGRIKSLIFIFIPVLALSFTISIVTLLIVKDQITQFPAELAQLHVSQIDRNFEVINNHMGWSVLNNENLIKLEKTIADGGFEQYHHALFSQFSEFQKSLGPEYNFFIYLREIEYFMNIARISITYPEYLQIKDVVIANTREIDLYDNYYYKWSEVKIRDKYFLVNIVPYNNRFIICIVSADDLIAPLRQVDLGNDGFVTLINNSDNILTSLAEPDEVKLARLGNSSSLASLISPYSLVSSSFTNAGLRTKLVLDRLGAFGIILFAQLFALLGIFVVTIIVLVTLKYTQTRLLRPIQAFTEGLANIESGNEHLAFGHSDLLELEQANEYFRKLVRQIKRLKMDIYEKELDRQRVQLDYMKMQIKPHFFLNCLSSVHSMAQNRQYAEIEKMTVFTSKYFRYIFKSNHDFVLLKNEVDHIKDYLEIQKIFYKSYLEYEITQNQDTYYVKIPPLVLQTFVENAVKHALSYDSVLQINLQIQSITDGEQKKVMISIENSGEGFSDEIFRQLEAENRIDQSDGEHIGINNVLNRLDLLYNGKSTIQFANTGRGAEVTLIIPAEIL